MSDDKPIDRESPLGRALDDFPVPELAGDFADRVLAGAKDRAPPLPELRQSGGGARRWRSVKRLGIATVAAGALASAAAATGLLDELPLPSAGEVWSAITGQAPEPAPTPSAAPRPDAVDIAPGVAPLEDTRIEIEGPIDTPEELEEAFRRIDEFRSNRKETRRSNVDRRIDETLERRRAQGLPVPTAEQEERLRGRIDRFRDRRDALTEERLQERREGLRERIENGEELTREDFIREQREPSADGQMRRRLQRLRNLPPEERRQRIRRFMERNAGDEASPAPNEAGTDQADPQPEPDSAQDVDQSPES